MKVQSQSFRALPIEVEPAHNPRDRAFGYVFAVIGAALFSTKAIFVKLAYLQDPELEALTLLTLRMVIALPLYLMIGIWAYRRYQAKPDAQRLHPKHFVFAGLLGFAGYYAAALLDFMGLQYITAQLERLILFTYPIFVIILGAVFMGKRITLPSIVAVVVAYSGIAVVFARGSIATGANVPLGVMLIGLAAFSFAIFQLLAPKMIKALGSGLFTCVAMISAGTGILLQYFTTALAESGEVFAGVSPTIWFIGVGIAIVATLIPSFFVNIALGRIGAQAVSIVSMVGPLVTVVLAVSVLSEPFTRYDGLGTILTIIGISIFTWYDRKAKATQGS